MKLGQAVLLTAIVLCLTGCGVTAQDKPEPITTLVPTATPTVSSRSVPPTPCPTGPESSGSRQVQPSPLPTQ
ncbi:MULTISPECIES: hypothetical protein [Amycolatopsis]|uniref:hypothetical protein n=1 Tax=Amycolatopsis TaxID=1813 RepID=UPI001C59D3EE|nr:hypothetical protein [Amycolatopsis sp. TNS106]QXV55751.1 hypothetical protein CVV72_01080 [Amycolatopsis sp. TNS106]